MVETAFVTLCGATGCIMLGLWLVLAAKGWLVPVSSGTTIVGFFLGVGLVAAVLARSGFQPDNTSYMVRWLSAAPALVVSTVVLLHVAVHSRHATLQMHQEVRPMPPHRAVSVQRRLGAVAAGLALIIFVGGPVVEQLTAQDSSETVALHAAAHWQEPAVGFLAGTNVLPFWPTAHALVPSLVFSILAVALCVVLRWQDGSWQTAAGRSVRWVAIAAAFMFVAVWLVFVAESVTQHQVWWASHPVMVVALWAAATVLCCAAWAVLLQLSAPVVPRAWRNLPSRRPAASPTAAGD